MWLGLLLLILLLSGCYVNRAVIDPFGYAPESPCWYWKPDRDADALSCSPPVSQCPELPCEEHVLCLGEILDIALVNNPQTELSWSFARQYAAEYGQSQSSFLPSITANYYYESQRTSFLASTVEVSSNIIEQELIIDEHSQWGPRADITWTLLDFGQRRFTSEAARYALYFANYQHNQAVQELLQNVTLDFYDYLYQKKLLEADQADLATAEETLAAAEMGLRTGAKNISDVLQARTQTLLAEIQLSEQHKVVNTSYATLLTTIGLPSNAKITLQKLPFVDPDSVDLDPLSTYLDIAMQCRPDLLAQRSSVISAENTLTAAKRAWTPTVQFTSQVGNTTFTGGFNDKYNYINTITLSMPLFTGFSIRNTIRASQAVLEQQEAGLKQIELNVIQDVSTAHYNVTVAFNTLKAANKFLEATKEEYEVALAQYKAGVNTILDVISAQSSLFDARARQASALKEWFSSLATLTYSAGMLSQNLGDCP